MTTVAISDSDGRECKDSAESGASFNTTMSDPAQKLSPEHSQTPPIPKNAIRGKNERALALTPGMTVGQQNSNKTTEADVYHNNANRNFSENDSLFAEAAATTDMIGPQHNEVVTFPTRCPHCQSITETNMHITDVPYFKEVIMMCLLCEQCGYRSNEIKSGGIIPDFGTKITLYVKNEQDLKREVLKSDTAGMSIPELDLQLQEGGLGSVYTTIEGLLLKVHDGLRSSHPFWADELPLEGELIGNEERRLQTMELILMRLKKMASGEQFPFTLTVTDPLSNSFVGPTQEALSVQMGQENPNSLHKRFSDNQMLIEEYERTHDR